MSLHYIDKKMSGYPIETVLIAVGNTDAAVTLEKIITHTFPNAKLVLSLNFKRSMEYIDQSSWDLAIIDITLSGDKGLNLVRHIHNKGLNTLCIVTSMSHDEELPFEALQYGACMYPDKHPSVEEFESFLIETISGRPTLSPRTAQLMLRHFQHDQHSTTHEYTNSLTDREREVLNLIAKGYQIKEVCQLLGISLNTLKLHVKSLYDKLKVQQPSETTFMQRN